MSPTIASGMLSDHYCHHAPASCKHFDWWTTLEHRSSYSTLNYQYWVSQLLQNTHGWETVRAGIVDDIYGASFVDGAVSGDPMDANGHGTFVAGVVGAVGNNNLGVTGMNQAINLIACQFMDATGNGWVSDAIQCIDYCISKEAHIMSNSWGGVAYSSALQVSSQSLAMAWRFIENTTRVWHCAVLCSTELGEKA